MGLRFVRFWCLPHNCGLWPPDPVSAGSVHRVLIHDIHARTPRSRHVEHSDAILNHRHLPGGVCDESTKLPHRSNQELLPRRRSQGRVHSAEELLCWCQQRGWMDLQTKLALRRHLLQLLWCFMQRRRPCDKVSFTRQWTTGSH